uniref:Uncharacterized protein n=1 Tax=Sciurus vulgaris TaxID=55149 RepID=A0A8D2DU22_SCIVU
SPLPDYQLPDLSGIARNEPDVYETSDLPEDDQAKFDVDLEELTSTSVDTSLSIPVCRQPFMRVILPALTSR